jgi:ATP-dependent Lon protease
MRKYGIIALLLVVPLEVAALERRIKDRVRDQIDRNQREYYLRNPQRHALLQYAQQFASTEGERDG